MAPCAVFLAATTVLASVALITGAQARAEHRSSTPAQLVQGTGMRRHTTAPIGAPMSGSERSPGRPAGSGPMITSLRGTASTSNASSPEPVNTMPPGHISEKSNQPARSASGFGPMVGSSPNMVSTTGSAAEAESTNSMPPAQMAVDPCNK